MFQGRPPSHAQLHFLLWRASFPLRHVPFQCSLSMSENNMLNLCGKLWKPFWEGVRLRTTFILQSHIAVWHQFNRAWKRSEDFVKVTNLNALRRSHHFSTELGIRPNPRVAMPCGAILKSQAHSFWTHGWASFPLPSPSCWEGYVISEADVSTVCMFVAMTTQQLFGSGVLGKAQTYSGNDACQNLPDSSPAPLDSHKRPRRLPISFRGETGWI